MKGPYDQVPVVTGRTMNILLLSPVAIAMLLLGAHFLRGGESVLVLLCMLAPFLLLVRRAWVARTLQVALVVGALEWGWTTAGLIRARLAMGEDWMRMALILGGVATFTAGASLLFYTRTLRERYRLGHPCADARAPDPVP